MPDVASLLQAATAGAALGGMFFAGLWLTVRLLMTTSNPAPWFFGSLLLRMSAVLAGFYFVGGGRWDRLAACCAGFAAARVIVTLLPMREEVRDAP